MTSPSGQPQTAHGAPSPGNPADAALRCVIWHAAAGELPGELLSSLSRRIGRMSVCTDALTAVAECCLIEREHRRALAAANPAAPPVGGVLVVVHPRQLPEAPHVLDAVRTYAPCVAAWWYDRGANPKLRGVVEGDVQTWTAPPTPATLERPAPPAVTVVTPRLPAPATTNGHHAAPAPAQTAHLHTQPAQVRRGPLLTEDELAMLLSDEPIDLGAARGGLRSKGHAPGPNGHTGGTGS